MAGTQRQVTLLPMTPQEYVPYRETAIREFAREKVRVGDWAENEAPTLSAEEHDSLLPLGVETPEQNLFTARDAESGERVGTIWLALRLRAGRLDAYVYDIEVQEKHRGHGYGRGTMQAGIEKAREMGAETVGLHVFGHNAVARALYQSLGFVEEHVNMSLELHSQPAEL